MLFILTFIILWGIIAHDISGNVTENIGIGLFIGCVISLMMSLMIYMLTAIILEATLPISFSTTENIYPFENNTYIIMKDGDSDFRVKNYTYKTNTEVESSDLHADNITIKAIEDNEEPYVEYLKGYCSTWFLPEGMNTFQKGIIFYIPKDSILRLK